MADSPLPGWLLLALGAGFVALVRNATRPKRVFVSYDYDNDGHYKRLLEAWHANRRFAFIWEDHSSPLIQTAKASSVKAAITRRMKGAEILLVIVGRETASSKWVAWEIEKAKELGLRLVAVKIRRNYQSPSGLLSSGAVWAQQFSEDAVVKALSEVR